MARSGRLHADITDITVRCRYRSIACTRLLSTLSVRFGLRLNDVGIGTYIAVKGSDSVVVERIGSQAGHILTNHIAHVAILIACYVSHKGIARGHV